MIMSVLQLATFTASVLFYSVAGLFNSVGGIGDCRVVYIDGISFQMNGIIVTSRPEKAGVHRTMHEYGHYLQQEDMGFSRYVIEVVAPSMIGNIFSVLFGPGIDAYRRLPWEADADRRAMAYFHGDGKDILLAYIKRE